MRDDIVYDMDCFVTYVELNITYLLIYKEEFIRAPHIVHDILRYLKINCFSLLEILPQKSVKFSAFYYNTIMLAF